MPGSEGVESADEIRPRLTQSPEDLDLFPIRPIEYLVVI